MTGKSGRIHATARFSLVYLTCLALLAKTKVAWKAIPGHLLLLI